MKNLAGVEDIDEQIKYELERLGIEVVESTLRLSHPDVKTKYVGKLGSFTFLRNWTYWVVLGEVPLHLAEKMYNDKSFVGNIVRTDVRAGGDCERRPPSTWAHYYDKNGKELVNDPNGDEEKQAKRFIEKGIIQKDFLDSIRFVPDKTKDFAKAVVKLYHVDSELGLYIFTEALRNR